MLDSIFGFLLTVAGVLLVAFGIGGAVFAGIKGSQKFSPSRKVIAGAIIGGIAVIALAMSITIIQPGNVGVVTFLGSVQEQTLPPGIHLRLPILQGVKTFETRVQAHQFADLEAASKENLALKVTGTMNYHIDGSNASFLYSTVSDDFAAKIIDPAFADYIKQVVPAYSADSTSANWVLAHRDDIRLATKEALNINLARYHIIVDDIYIANIGNPDDYEAAIRARQVAQQQVETEKQVTQQRIQQANQAVEAAKGEANAKIEQAKGQAIANIEQAKGEAQASIEGNKGRIALAETQARNNALIAKSLTPELIQLRLIENITDNIQVVYLPSNGNFFLDPTKLLKAAQ